MAKVIMICGKLCSGKTTYAHRLMKAGNAALLSIDEIMLAMFGQHCGDMHEEYVARTEKFLLGKSLELIGAGIDVILDWGFWRKEQRERIRGFYGARGIECRMHIIHIDGAEWKKRIEKRNAEVISGKTEAYYVDENLARKFAGLFEEPQDGAADVNIYAHRECTEN